MQTPILRRLAERVESGLGFTVPRIVEQQQWHIEENLLGLCGRDSMALILPCAAFIPIKANNL